MIQTINSPIINNFEVIKASLIDAKEICHVVNEAFTTDIFRIRPRTSLSQVTELFDKDHTWYVVKVKENEISKIAGAVLYSKADHESDDLTNIQMLAVRPQYRGKKMGERLIKKVECKALKNGKEKIGLLVAEINPALCNFYKKQGYLETGEMLTLLNTSVRPEFKNNDPENFGLSKIHLLYMQKNLAA